MGGTDRCLIVCGLVFVAVALAIGDDFLLNIARHVFVVIQDLGMQAAAFSEGAEMGGVFVQFHLRHMDFHHLERALFLFSSSFPVVDKPR